MINNIRYVLAVGLSGLVVFTSTASTRAEGLTVGLVLNTERAFDGYTLFKPSTFQAVLPTAYLIDNNGRLVHSWDVPSVLMRHLLEDGSAIGLTFDGAQRVDWDGTPLWDYSYAGGQVHHDLAVLPNGNVLIIVRDVKSATDAIAAGRDPDLLIDDELWPEFIIEVEPAAPTGGTIVWEWHAWDHLVQDVDPGQDNYGVVADHPEPIDINFIELTQPLEGEADWHHANAINYNPELDQIVLTVRNFSEIWVIDHSTTTAEAASDSGGDSGRGGDLLYRWGNPQAYDAGDAGDQQLFSQHDARWIEPGQPGAGNILVFNNGNGRGYSSVDEIVPPVDGSGYYALTVGQSYGPEAPTWTFSAPVRTEFFASFISGAVRLPNGNTLINDGPIGTFFEVTPDGETVWKYVNPIEAAGPLTQGDPIPPTGLGVFRAIRYAPDYPGLVGRDLTPGGPLEIVLDSDDDCLLDHEESKIYGTEPFTADTDLDGLSDGDEVLVYVSDPLLADTDGDGLSDGDEVMTYGTDPALVDTDGHGFSDGDEIFIRGTDPLSAALLGDVDCDGDVSSIDAALILQLTAGVVTFLFCQEAGDVNGDGNTTSIDAALILQFTAGLIPSLSP